MRGSLLLSTVGLGLFATAFAGCTDNSNPTGPDVGEPFGTLTVDASADWTFVRLGDNASTVQVSDPASSTSWDIAFFATGVMLNSGAAGPSDVVGYCICQNENATDADVKAMTADTERADFEAVTTADIPTDEDSWQSDALNPAIDGWWRYDMATHTVSAADDQSWIVRTAEGDSYFKLRVTEIAGATRDNAGSVTLEFALFDEGTNSYGETKSLTVDVSGGPAHVDLLTGAVSDEENWDLRFEGFEVRVNGGVSGSGEAAAVLAGTHFDDTPPATEVEESVFAADQYGGVFDEHRWYRYNLEGRHQIWPTFNVYLIRVGDTVYKLQLTSYYRPSDGAARHITFRYAPLSE